ncbi:rCG63230 [Rattus norvegicus]|uniref:RCG63230 n=1 Tax=Rattus norvegicus TaxID=10116 RepID=A6IYM0_RAT|nr:rCG63230 [Rattus norvegicus]
MRPCWRKYVPRAIFEASKPLAFLNLILLYAFDLRCEPSVSCLCNHASPSRTLTLWSVKPT